jgi:hypothetical protein
MAGHLPTAEAALIRKRICKNRRLHRHLRRGLPELAESSGQGAIYLTDLCPMVHKFTADACGKAVYPIADHNPFARRRKVKSSIL